MATTPINCKGRGATMAKDGEGEVWCWTPNLQAERIAAAERRLRERGEKTRQILHLHRKDEEPEHGGGCLRLEVG